MYPVLTDLVAVSTCSNWLFNFTIVMITPIMIANLGVFGFGTYIFFGAMNALFIPIIYFFYPETAKRSLEEIDLIFAKGYLENISYVKAAKELPYLNDAEVQEMSRQYGFADEDEEYKIGEKGLERRSGSERSVEAGEDDNGAAKERVTEKHRQNSDDTVVGAEGSGLPPKE